jgi:hypothetical protein
MKWSCAALALAAISLAARADDKVFAPKNGMFTITLPAGEKTEGKTRILTIKKRKVPIESSTTSKGGTVFSGGSIGIPAVVMRQIPAESRFDVLRDSFAQALNGKAIETKDIKQGDVPGKEYLFELPKGQARLQVYTVAGWVIVASVEGNKEQVRSKDADAFFRSLKLTDEAKKVFSEVKR